MVHKTTKHQVHSGNTLRASNSRYNRRYRRQGFLVRHMNEGAKSIRLLDELNIGENGVAYSLNKKSRWNIPLILKQEILYNKNMLDYTTGVTLIESHKLKKSSKCISYCSSKGPITKVTPKKSRTYFNSSSVSQKANTKKKNTQENDDPSIKVKEPPQLTVNVFYPCPVTSAITHNPKNIRVPEVGYSNNDDEDVAIQKPDTNFSTKSKTRRQRKRIALSGKSQDVLWDLEEDVDDLSDEDDMEEFSKEYSRQGNSADTLSLEDILLHTEKIQNIYRESTPSRNMISKDLTEDRKGKVIHTTEIQNGHNPKCITTENSRITPPETEMMPVTINLPIQQTQQDFLRDMFGRKYSECPCFPRKFTIDISDKVHLTLSRSKAFANQPVNTIDTTAVLVFVYNVYQGLESTSQEIFDVYLNMNTCQSSTRIEFLMANANYCLEEVVQRSVAFVETIPFDMICRQTKCFEIASTRHRTKFNLLYDACQTKTTTFSPDEKLYFDQVLQPVITVKDADSIQLSDLGYESFPPENCSICFESMIERSATASQACGHWFCDTCWKDHLANTMLSESGHVLCPEYKCSKEIPIQCLLNTIGIRKAIKLTQISNTNAINFSKESKWCPNKTCGMVIKTENIPKHMNISCQCGTTICFDCMQPAHWPMSCLRSKSYFSALRKNGDDVRWPGDDLKPILEVVQGKPCPKCNRFIEKLGGCFTMSCPCRCMFCWGCGKAYDGGHVTTKDCVQSDVGDSHNTVKKTVFSELEKRKMVIKKLNTGSKIYKAAVENRLMRHPSQIKTLHSKTVSITQKLKQCLWRNGHRIGRELINFGDNSNPMLKERHISEKVGPFLKQMVEIYSELCHIAEFTRIYSEDSNNISNVSFCRGELVALLDKIESLANSISNILHRGCNNDMTIIIAQLWNLRFHSEMSINALVRGLRTRKH